MKKVSRSLQELLTPFHKDFLTSDVSSIKKKYASDRVTVELAAFIKLGQEMIQLEEMTSALLKAHPLMSEGL